MCHDGVGGVLGIDLDLGFAALVHDVGCAKDAAAEAIVPIEAGMILGVSKGVVGGAEADDGLARLEIIFDVVPFGVGKFEEAEEEDGKIGLGEGFDAREDVFGFLFGIAFPHHDGGAKAKFLELLGVERHGELRRIMERADDEDDVWFLFFGEGWLEAKE